MGVITITEEYTSPIPPARLFKALFLDADNFLPKLLPQVLKSIELVQGDGGAGSVKQMNFAEGIGLGALKHRIDEINEETFVYNYTLIEGEDLVGKLEKVSHETKFEPSPDGGSISKITSKYYTLDDAAITEDEIKASKEKAMGMYKAVEGYLLQNPDAYG